MIGFKLSDAKKLFFDRKGIEAAFTKAERSVFNQFGGFTRKTARNSMRNVGKKAKALIASIQRILASPAARYNRAFREHWRQQLDAARRQSSSQPGRPPKAIVGTVKKLLVYAADMVRRSVVIGPTLANRPTGAPRTLEEGGSTTLGRGAGRRRVRVRRRPYMQPAFKKARARLPGMWRNSIRKK